MVVFFLSWNTFAGESYKLDGCFESYVGAHNTKSNHHTKKQPDKFRHVAYRKSCDTSISRSGNSMRNVLIFARFLLLRRSKKKDAILKPDFDSLPVVEKTKLKKGFEALFLSFH